jgi:hypothetical protein
MPTANPTAMAEAFVEYYFDNENILLAKFEFAISPSCRHHSSSLYRCQSSVLQHHLLFQTWTFSPSK